MYKQGNICEILCSEKIRIVEEHEMKYIDIPTRRDKEMKFEEQEMTRRLYAYLYFIYPHILSAQNLHSVDILHNAIDQKA